jgi:MFS transporter, putative metabolite:H+ symporter
MDAEDATVAKQPGGADTDLGPDEIRVRGNIVARLDRLPLTPQLWTYALIAQLFWGAVLSLDPVALRLYPVLWLPAHAFSSLQYDILVGFENGAGVLIGQIIFTYLADRYGRKPMMIASCVVASLFVWPVAYTSNWPLLMVFVSMAALGVGGCLGLSNVYTVEIAPPQQRARLSLGSQILAAVVVNVISGLLPYYMLPAQYRLWVWVTALIPVVIVLPLIAFVLPESPRWLESRERTDKAEAIMAGLERHAEKRTGKPLPEPQYDRYTVVVEEHERVPVGELFRGIYARRTAVILVVWVLGYGGLDYGLGSQQSVYLIGFYTASKLFLIIFLGGLIGTLLMTVLGATLNERVERRTWIFIAGLMSFAGGVIYFFWARHLWLAVLGTVLASGAVLVWAFNGYTMIAAAYPTRLRATASGFIDGLGHVGAVFGPIFAGWLFTVTASDRHIGWFLEFGVLGGLIPGIVSLLWGMRQKEAILEEMSQ